MRSASRHVFVLQMNQQRTCRGYCPEGVATHLLRCAVGCFVVQTGLYEMKEMVQLTGGQCVQIDSFTNVVFKDSLKRMFAK